MVVLHAAWSRTSGLCLWGEHDERRRRGAADRHPFGCAGMRLRAAMAQPGHGLPAGVHDADVVLLLPTRTGAPLPSPELLQGRGPGAGRSGLRPWRVPALAIDPEAAVDLLLSRPPAPGLGLAVGASFTYVQEVGKLALELAAHGRIRPTLERDGDTPVARWRSAPDTAGGARLLRLGQAMPPLLRAEVTGGDGGGHAASAVVDGLLDLLLDGIARRALASADGALLRPRRGRAPAAPPAAEAWLLALAGSDREVHARPGDVGRLGEELEAWRAGGSGADLPLRLCFRVQAPEEPDGADTDGPDRWSIEFALQGRDDPSLIVPAADVWRARGGLVVFERLMDHPEEHLLAELGRASRLFPDLEAALAIACPTALDLDSGGAHRFLSETAPLLTEAGFGVHAPPWWGSRSARLGLRLRTRRSGEKEWVSGPSRFGLDSLCEYEWELAMGDQPLSEAELRELASLKQPLVRVRGRWVELRPQDAEAALALMGRKTGAGAGHMTAGEVLRIGLGLAPTVDGLPVVEVRADGWMADFLGGTADRRLEAVRTPGGFSGSLRPYQERGLAWLRFLGGLGLGACLADDMGLGKTVQLLAVLLAERPGARAPEGPGGPDGACRRPTLLVCPMSVVGNWQREASRFAPDLRVHVHHGMGRLGGAELAAAAAASDLVITTYALAARDQESLAAIEWGRVVLDEAQNVKTSTAKQTKAVRALRAPERVALTGTPVENRLTELWSIMEFLNPGLLGAYAEFRAHVATPVERYRDEEATRLLKRVTQPFILRRLKTDRTIIADLPDKVEMKVFCNITREQATLYQAVLDEMMERIAASEGIERSGLVLAGLMKLKQVLNHPAQMLRDGSRLDGRSGKLARTEEILEEVLAAGEKALVFTQFSEMGELLQGHLAARFAHEVLFLHGGTPKRLRDEMVERFQSSAGPPVFVLSLKAGGTGLNLTAASHVIHFDRWWNPAVEDQATDRAFRIGQRRDVQVRKLVCVGTLEERIDGMIEDKRELAGRIVGSGESWLTQLSTRELREVVALTADAVAEG